MSFLLRSLKRKGFDNSAWLHVLEAKVDLCLSIRQADYNTITWTSQTTKTKVTCAGPYDDNLRGRVLPTRVVHWSFSSTLTNTLEAWFITLTLLYLSHPSIHCISCLLFRIKNCSSWIKIYSGPYAISQLGQEAHRNLHRTTCTYKLMCTDCAVYYRNLRQVFSN